MVSKRKFLAASAAAAACAYVGLPVMAAGFPEHELKLVIPFAPGGATDVVFRVISERAEKELGQPVVPMNMGGAGGSRGSTFVHTQKADGYTLLGGHEFLLTTYYGGMVNFGIQEFEPVCTLTFTPMFFSAGKHAPYKTFKEMVAYIKANPGKAVVAMTPASIQYVMWKQAEAAGGFNFDKDVRVVIINGNGPQTKAILGEHVEAATGDLPSHQAYIKDGRLVVLGVANDERLAQLPDVPTMKEQGYDVKFGATRAIFAPTGTPREAVEKIAAAYKIACADPEVIKKITDMGNLMTYKGPDETKALFNEFDKIFAKSLGGQKK